MILTVAGAEAVHLGRDLHVDRALPEAAGAHLEGDGRLHFEHLAENVLAELRFPSESIGPGLKFASDVSPYCHIKLKLSKSGSRL